MSAEKFFNSHSIEEISKKTKISPISLKLIKNKEFKKIPKVKFLGFIKIIENSYNVDLSDLIEEYNNQNKPTKIKKEEPKINSPKKKVPKNNTFLITFLAFILIIIGGYLLFKNSNNPKKNINEKNISIVSNIKIKPKKEENLSLKEIIKPILKETNSSKENNISNQTFKVIIIPKKRLWFKAINIDTNKSISYLTSHQKILPKGNYYIKFGHGELNLTYNNQTIFPDTKKIIRILLKNGKYKFMKKPNKYEK